MLEEVSAPGGPTTNTAVALSRLGARVVLASAVGDERGRLVRRSPRPLIDTRWLTVKPAQVTTLATVIVSRNPLDRTIFVETGAQLMRGDQLDVAGLFGGDVWSSTLRTFRYDASCLICLAHRTDHAHSGSAQVSGGKECRTFDLALRHDVIVSNEPDLLDVTGTWTLSDATAAATSHARRKPACRPDHPRRRGVS